MISVIVPIYNVKSYMENCINTILAQTYRDFEIILVDDGSTDGCDKLCDKCKEKDNRIKVIHQDNGGLSAARNAGIEIAKGEYITFIDSDDFIHRDMLQILLENIEEEQAQISVCGFLNVYESESVKEKRFHTTNLCSTVGSSAICMFEKMKEKSYKKDREVYSSIEAVKKIIKYQEKNMIVVWGKLYKGDLLKEIRFPIGKCHEDEFTTYKLFYKAEKIVVTTAQLYYYLQRNTSIMGTGYSIKRLDKLEGLKACIGYFKEKKETELFHLAQYRYLFHIQIAYYRTFYEMKDNKKVLEELGKEYDKEYKNSHIKKSPVVSFQKKCLLAFFFREKRIYCFLVKIYTKINTNLSE